MIRVALVTTDSREHYKRYSDATPSFGTAPQGLLDGFATLPGIEVHVISCLQQRVESPEKLAPNIWYHALHVPKIGWLRTGYQGCIRAVRRKLREIEPDIVHGQGTERDCALAAVLSGFPSVLTIHGNMRLIAEMFRPKPFSPMWLAANLEGWTIRRAAGVVCISTYTERAVAPLARRTWLLPNAVDWSFSRARSRTAAPPRLLCIASVDPRKNQNALIDALASLAGRMPFELTFFGGARRDSDYGSAFFERVDRFPWCRYGGLIDRGQLREQFQDASAIILPTREDNCPMVVLEGMAAGVPVVASAVGGIPDFVDHERTGLLTDPSRPETMLRAVERLLSEPALGEALAANGMREAGEKFRPEVIARHHLEIYGEVLGRPS